MYKCNSPTSRSATPPTKHLFRQFCDKQAKALKTKLPFLTSAQINAKVKKKWLSLSSERKLTACQELSKFPRGNSFQKGGQDIKAIPGLKRKIFFNSPYFRSRISEEFYYKTERKRKAINELGEWTTVTTVSEVDKSTHEPETFDSDKDSKKNDGMIEEAKLWAPALRRSKRLMTKAAFNSKPIKERKQRHTRKKLRGIELSKSKSLSANLKLRKRVLPPSIMQEYEFDDGFNCLSASANEVTNRRRTMHFRPSSSEGTLPNLMQVELIKGIETWQSISTEIKKPLEEGDFEKVGDITKARRASSAMEETRKERLRNETQSSRDNLLSNDHRCLRAPLTRSHDFKVVGNKDITPDCNFDEVSRGLTVKAEPKESAVYLSNATNRFPNHQHAVATTSPKQAHKRSNKAMQFQPGKAASKNFFPLELRNREETSHYDECTTENEYSSDHSSDSSQDRDAVFITRSGHSTQGGSQLSSDLSCSDSAQETKLDEGILSGRKYYRDYHREIPLVLHNFQNTKPELIIADETLKCDGVTKKALQTIRTKKPSCTNENDQLEIQEWGIARENTANENQLTSDKQHEDQGYTKQRDDLLCDMFREVDCVEGQTRRYSFSRILGSIGETVNATSFKRSYYEESIFL